MKKIKEILGEPTIKIILISVLNQSFPDFEFIIIDDGSTDNTFLIINEWAKKDKRIIILKNEKNLGIQKSANRGLKIAQGEYIVRIDDDDDEWIDQNKFKKQVEFLDKNPDYVLVGTKSIVVDKNNQELYQIDQSGLDETLRKKMLLNNFFITSTILFRKDALLKVGGYSEAEKEKHVEDYDLVLKLGTIGKIAILDFYGMKFIHHHRISQKYKKEQLKKSLYLIKKYRGYYSEHCKAFLIRLIGLVIYGFLGLPLLAVLKNKFKIGFRKNKNDRFYWEWLNQ